MQEYALLIDFGSTYTKVTGVEASEGILLGTASSFTTIETGIGEGLSKALTLLEKQTGKLDYSQRLACSSAAGGLRMIACGLVPELTAKAAQLASLGAGAKVTGLYSYQLTQDDIQEIADAKPDILLLTGGIDGGNTECILHNAKMLSECPADFPVVVAGNRSCGREVVRLLGDRQSYLCSNVMPRLGVLDVLPAQQKIRELFLERIVQAKGLSDATQMVDGILMPTPAAVLTAIELLAKGWEDNPGLGELMAIDLGGATTDVYSVAGGMPQNPATVYKGLPEPYAKRTVEGDIGMRYSARGIAEAAGIERVAQLAGISSPEAEELVELVSSHPDILPHSPQLEGIDFALASLAVETATLRHAGTIEQVYTMTGPAYVQEGKDLTDLQTLVVTGGSVIHAPRVAEIAAHALYRINQPQSLRPKQAEVLVDEPYILSAMGLLAGHHPAAALNVMKKEMTSHGAVQ